MTEGANSLLVERFIGFVPDKVCRGDFSLHYVPANPDHSKVQKSLSRRWTHVQTKDAMAKALALQIQEDLKKGNDAPSQKSDQQEFVVSGLAKKDKAVLDNALTNEIEFNAIAHPGKMRNALISAKRTEIVQTHSKTFGELQTYLDEDNSKRKLDDGPEVAQQDRKRVKMSSFGAEHQKVSDLANQALEHAVLNAQKTQAAVHSLHRYLQVTPQDIQRIIFIPFHPNQKPCVKGLFCQSMIEPLRHPLRDEPCMGFIPPIVWDALRMNVKMTPLNTEAEHRLFKHDMCEFCFRSWVTEQVGKNMGSEQIPDEQILSRHYSTDLPGSWDKSAMIAPERNKKTQHLHGLFGNVPSFNPKNFRPIVAIMNQEWEVQTFIEVSVFQQRKAEYTTSYVAYGWIETGPFYQLNNMMQPKVNQQDPYVNVITEVEGGYTLSTVLAGYFRNYSGVDYSQVFAPFNELLRKDIFKLNYPGFHPALIGKFEAEGKLRNVGATELHIKYWPWNEGLVFHSMTNDPPYERFKIYYTVIWVLNAVAYLRRFPSLTIQRSIQLKLDAFCKMYYPLLYYMQSNPFDDEALSYTFMCFPEVACEAPVSYVLAPRHGDDQKLFRVEDFQYLRFTHKKYARLTPDAQLKHHYIDMELSSLPHKTEFMDEFRKFDDYLESKKADPYNCYAEITSTFKMFNSCLRRYVAIEWPADTLTHLAGSELNESFKEGQVTAFFAKVRECFIFLLALLDGENSRYTQYLKWLPHVICDFNQTSYWIYRCLNASGTAKDLFASLNVANLNHLLPIGFTATPLGINGSVWSKNVICLTLLIRVYILEEMHLLEDRNDRETRYNLLLLRNSHFALQRAITENGYLLPVKTDRHLRSMAATRQGLFDSTFTRINQLRLSIFEATYPLPTREVHEGMLPVSHCMLLNNFFSELDKPCFPFQKIISATLLKCTVHSEFLDILNGTENTPLRQLLYFMIELSLKGLYRSADITPGFQISCQLDETFRNLDCKAQRLGLNKWLSQVIKSGEEKICFQQFIDHLYMEYVYYNLQCNPVVHDLLLLQYKDEFWTRSLTMMDICRTVMKRTNSVDLPDIHYYTQVKFELKTSRKVLRPNNISFFTFLQFVIIQSDKERYHSKNFCPPIPKVDQTNIQDFVRHLNPNGILFKDDLIIPFNGCDATVECVNQIYEIYRKCATTTNIGALTKQAISTVQQIDVTQQYALLARLAAELYAYRKFKTTRLLDAGFVWKQVEILCKVSACSRMEDIPHGKTIACIAPCCCSLKKSLANKQFKPVNNTPEGELIVYCTLGNRDLAVNPADRRITCGNKGKGPKQGKRASQSTSRQRPKKVTLKGNSLAALQEQETLRKIALNQTEQDDVAPVLLNFVSNEETINKKVENQRAVEGIGLACESTEPLMISILGSYLECDQSLKITGAKRREAQKLASLKRQRPDVMRIQHNNRPQNVTPGLPPLILSPCCGELSSYQFMNLTGAGYSCGWCLPMANEFAAFRTENICEVCHQVLANKPTGNICPVSDCSTTYVKCPHGAFPILMYDDLQWMCMRKIFVCDACYHAFLPFEKCNFLYAFSMIKNGNADVVRSIISR